MLDRDIQVKREDHGLDRLSFRDFCKALMEGTDAAIPQNTKESHATKSSTHI